MISKLNKIYTFLKQEEAATAVEYAVMIALIMLACIGAVGALGFAARDMWGGNLADMIGAFGH